ncbi:DUF1961 family protein [Flavobacterium sp. ASW18X]|uniref:DUF1961 family protein n=1 Tax=Flavobacterium sp. ASW18X TaxID=2572595 RepID=UPI0010AE86A9|nr:DUF1961 family protein [Flavobacterium sp. ASW18X]TKD63390.1 DUF1961 family protein [Flavobacterium sp. ASW18X]
MKAILICIAVMVVVMSCKNNQALVSEKASNRGEWNLTFYDDCTKDWSKLWFLDGLKASVENSDSGMHFKAGPEAENDAHHAVLWTKESYSGDLKIKFDYTRTDTANKYVNILYIQATGDGEGDYVEDIYQWKNKREVPAMRKYFENLDVFHISFAAFGNTGDGFHYVRARRYPKMEDQSFKNTQIAPSYDMQGFFETGKTYHITAIKTTEKLSFKMEHDGKEQYFEWDISDIAPINIGRIGLRHMYTRSARYSNFKIYTK